MSDFLVVKPGDTLIVTRPDAVTPEIAADVRARLLERLPGLADVVVIGRASGVAVFRPGDIRELENEEPVPGGNEVVPAAAPAPPDPSAVSQDPSAPGGQA